MVLQNNTYELYPAFSIQIVIHVGLFNKLTVLLEYFLFVMNVLLEYFNINIRNFYIGILIIYEKL